MSDVKIHFYWCELPHCDGCGKPATKEIRGSGNVRYGYACDKCAPKKLKQLDKAHNS